MDRLKLLPNIYVVLDKIGFEKLTDESDRQKVFSIIQKFYTEVVNHVERSVDNA